MSQDLSRGTRVRGSVMAVWGYFQFKNWTWAEPEDAARIRATWSRRRQAVRPLGGSALLAALILSIVLGSSRPFWSIVTFSVLTAIIIGCVVYGIVDGYRWRRAHRPERASAGKRLGQIVFLRR